MTDVASFFRDEASPFRDWNAVKPCIGVRASRWECTYDDAGGAMRDTKEIRERHRNFLEFCSPRNGGLIILGSALASSHRDLIINLGSGKPTRCPAAFFLGPSVCTPGSDFFSFYGADRELTISGRARRFTWIEFLRAKPCRPASTGNPSNYEL